MVTPEEVALSFDRACRAAGVRYAFFGGVAARVWGGADEVTDIAALLELDGADLDRFAKSLRNEGFACDAETLARAARGEGDVFVAEEEAVCQVDLRVAQGPEEARGVREAVEVALETGVVRVARAEDSVAQKLRLGTAQDLDEAEAILATQRARLDPARLRHLARKFDVEDELDRLLE